MNNTVRIGAILSIGFFGIVAEAGDGEPETIPTSSYEEAAPENESGWAEEIEADTAKNEADRERLEALPPDSPEARQIQADIGRRGDKAEGYADRAPTNVPVLTAAVDQALGNGDVARAQGRADQAVDAAEAETDPKKFAEKWPLAMNARAKVAKKMEDYPTANAYALKVLEKFPKDPNALALYHETRGRGKASPSGTGTPAAGGPAAPAPGSNPAAAPAPPGASGVAMTSPASLEARKQLALGWSRLKLDPAAALKNFEAAITADPLSAAVRVERSKARLAAGDAPGALGDAEDAVRLEPRLGEAYAARAEAKRALGRAEAELVSDYETASSLDGRFTEAYKAIAARLASASSAGAQADGSNTDAAEGSAPDGFRGRRTALKKWGLLALLLVLAAAAGGLLAPLLLKRRRIEDPPAPPPTPRP